MTTTAVSNLAQWASPAGNTSHADSKKSGPGADPGANVRWRLGTRIVFRFVFVYMLLECLYIANSLTLLYRYFLFHKLGFGFFDPVYHRVVPWIGAHVVHLSQAITVFSNGSGDTTYDQVLLCTNLFIAAVATIVWSLLDRKRPNHRKLFTWLRTIVSFFLAAEMISYGFDKAFPLQFGIVSPMRAAQTIGNLSGEGMLWTFMAASTAYTIFGGVAEVVSGVLLFIPRLRTLGALMTIGVMGNVFALNMDYNVPVKLASLQYLLMAIFLVVPEIVRLSNVFLFNRPAAAAVYAPLFQKKRKDRIAMAVYAFLAVFVFSLSFYVSHDAYGMRAKAMNAPKPILYGVWSVERVATHGAGALQFSNGDARWRQMIFASQKVLVVEPVSGPPLQLTMNLDAKDGSLVLKNPKAPAWVAQFKFHLPKPHVADLQGTVNGEPVELTLHETDYRLMSRGFHWINEHSY